MRISIYQNLQSSRSYSASTGLTQQEFEELAKDFCTLYQRETYSFPKEYGQQPSFADGKELLFLLLFYKKVYPTFDVLALSFGISNATAHQYIQVAKKLLRVTLAQRQLLPKRFFKDDADFQEFFDGVEELFVDATERPIQRPENKEVQKESYSVKKTVCAEKHYHECPDQVYLFPGQNGQGG